MTTPEPPPDLRLVTSDDEPTDDGPGDPLLARATRIGELPLPERPAAIEAVNRALVGELNALEDG